MVKRHNYWSPRKWGVWLILPLTIACGSREKYTLAFFNATPSDIRITQFDSLPTKYAPSAESGLVIPKGGTKSISWVYGPLPEDIQVSWSTTDFELEDLQRAIREANKLEGSRESGAGIAIQSTGLSEEQLRGMPMPVIEHQDFRFRIQVRDETQWIGERELFVIIRGDSAEAVALSGNEASRLKLALYGELGEIRQGNAP
jgi:hypothetical protein